MPRKHLKSAPIWRQPRVLVPALGVILVAAGLFIYLRPDNAAVTSTVPSPSIEASATPSPDSPNTSPGQPTSSPSSSSPTTVPTPLEAPILQKSSGNNGPIPAGAVVEFVCRTTAQQECSVTLTEQSSGKVITLAKKTNQSDGRGTYGSTWSWTATTGTWKIAATASKNGATGISAEQTITVQ